MGGPNGTMPRPLAMAARRFEKWRSGNFTRRRIPEDLWDLAADLSGRYGVNRTALALHLDYYRLKHRQARISARNPKGPKPPSRFVEIVPASPGPFAPTAGRLVEFEDPRGAKMRVHLAGGDGLDLLALGRLFLEGRA